MSRSQSRDRDVTWLEERKELRRIPKSVHLAAAVRLSREAIRRSALRLAEKSQVVVSHSELQDDLLQLNKRYLADWINEHRVPAYKGRNGWNAEEGRKKGEDNSQGLKLWNTLYSA